MAGGSRIVISDEGITISTGGKIVYQAGQHKFEGGEKVVSHFPILPTVDKGLFNVSVQLTDRENIPYKNKAYFAITESGKMYEGTTDSEGYTTPIYTEEQENINFHLIDKLENNIEDEKWENPSQD